MSVTNPLLEKNKSQLGNTEITMFSLGFAAISFINLGFGTYLSYFWSDIALIPLAAMGSIFVISRFLDGGTDIVIGFLVDRTNTKYGKARPWLLWMALPGLLSMAALFYVPNFSETGRIAWAFITYNMVAFFTLTAITLPLQSLTVLMTNDPKKRLTLNMVGQSFGTAATVIGNLYVLKAIESLGGGADGYFKFFAMLAVVATAMILVTFAGTKERVDRPVGKKVEKITAKVALKSFVANKWWVLVTLLQLLTMTYPALMAINMYYMTWVMKNPALMGPFMSAIFVSLLLTLIVFTPLVPRVGKINAGFIGMFFQIVGGIMPLFAPGNTSVMMVSGVFRGIGPAMLLGTRLAFMCDVVEYGEWKTGIRIEGLVFSGASMGAKIGTGLGAAVVAMMLARGGYVGGALTQTAEALSSITITFTWLHALSSALVTACLFTLRGLEKQMPQIMADLEARKAKTV
ncbi:MAG: glycoside-pentoside-hexuronide (GPH):cation symporter [Firmicutes bacterium]|nr:glycoside-pentoside-hexuronide (GPH):cation symporter [Bacillota bacterium]